MLEFCREKTSDFVAALNSKCDFYDEIFLMKKIKKSVYSTSAILYYYIYTSWLFLFLRMKHAYSNNVPPLFVSVVIFCREE